MWKIRRKKEEKFPPKYNILNGLGKLNLINTYTKFIEKKNTNTHTTLRI